jgi:hypothetical protein
VASAANGTGIASGQAGAPSSATPLEERVQKLEESTSLIGSKIDEQYQTKVESASKYRARLHGIVLMNSFLNRGSSDNLDFPSYSEPVRAGWPSNTLGATLRHSAWKFLGRISPEPKPRPTFRWISQEDFPEPGTV